jgi:YVTN family beta-propeller protein
VGSAPMGVAIAPDGKHAYVTNFESNNVSKINTATNLVEATIQVGKQPEGIAIAPDGKHAYVANSGSNTVSVVDTFFNDAAPVTVEGFPNQVATVVSPVHHVIVVVGENRSFDHVFGVYKPGPGQVVSNLLSKGIVNEDGTPGAFFSRARQNQNAPQTSYFIGADQKTPLIFCRPPSFSARPMHKATRSRRLSRVSLAF